VRGRHVTLAIGIAAALPVLISTGRAIGQDWAPYYDQAYIGASALDVFTTHPPLVGRWSSASSITGNPTYSLGPLLYWLLAIPARLPPDVSMMVWMGLVNVAAVLGTVALARRRGGFWLMVATAAAIALMCGSLPPEALRDVGNGTAPLLSFALLLFLCWSLACGEYRLLPVTVLVASFVLQAHLGFVPPVLGVLAVGVGGLLLSRRGQWGAMRGWVVGALVVGAVCWSAPLLDQAIHRPGNLVQVSRAARADKETLGAGAGWSAVVREIGVRPWWLRPPADSGPERTLEVFDVPANKAADPGLVAAGTAVLVLLAALAVTWVGARRRRWDVVAAGALSLVVCATLAYVAASTPRVNLLVFTLAYTLLWASPAGMFVWLGLGWSAATLWLPAVRRRIALASVPAPAAPAAIVAVAGLGAVVGFTARSDTYENEYRSARALAARLDAEVPEGATVRVNGAPDQIDPVGVAIYALRKSGHRVITPFAYYVGQQSTYDVAGRDYDYRLEIRGGDPPGRGGQVLARNKWEVWGGTVAVTATLYAARPR
jgi:hypothetical protein